MLLSSFSAEGTECEPSRIGLSTQSRDAESFALPVGFLFLIAAVSVTCAEGSVAASRKSPSGTLRGMVTATGGSVIGPRMQ